MRRDDGLGYHFLLPAAHRTAGIAHLGTDGAHERLAAKLHGGRSITVAVLGASVAQNGGCLAQPGARCMQRSGTVPDLMSWGLPRTRPFKGFLVRWFEWLNATWPHVQHALVNNARDATSLSTIMPCLASYLPPQGADVVVIEAGSMFLTHTAGLLEQLLRAIDSMRAPPCIIFLTVHVWCTFGGSFQKKVHSFGLKEVPHRHYNFFGGHYGELANASQSELASPRFIRRWQATSGKSRTSLAVANAMEDGLNLLCARYNVSCVSMRDALSPGFFAGRPGFTIEDLGADCLHPSHGRLGTEYMTDMLVYWTMRVAAAHRPAVSKSTTTPWSSPVAGVAGLRAAGQLRTDQGRRDRPSSPFEMPAPLFREQWPRADGEIAACYTLADARGRGSMGGLRWQTAACRPSVARDMIVGMKAWLRNGTGSASSALNELVQSRCDHSSSTHHRSSKQSYAPEACPRDLLGALPLGWTHCQRDEMSGKPSTSVSAYRAGATLLLELPLNWLPVPAMHSSAEHDAGSARVTRDPLATSPHQRFNATLQYLTSWHPSMATAWILCFGTCSCGEHGVGLILSGHQTSSVRNVSVFADYTFGIQLFAARRSECALSVRVQEGDESAALPVYASGASLLRRFKLRGLVLSTLASPCAAHAERKFLFKKLQLQCGAKPNVPSMAVE